MPLVNDQLERSTASWPLLYISTNSTNSVDSTRGVVDFVDDVGFGVGGVKQAEGEERVRKVSRGMMRRMDGVSRRR